MPIASAAAHVVFTVLFLIAAGLLAVLAPGHAHFDPLLVGLLVIAYALAMRVEFAAGAGIMVPTQLLFVPFLLLAPTPAVPLLVALSAMLCDLDAAARRGLDLGRALIAPANAWFASPRRCCSSSPTRRRRAGTRGRGTSRRSRCSWAATRC